MSRPLFDWATPTNTGFYKDSYNRWLRFVYRGKRMPGRYPLWLCKIIYNVVKKLEFSRNK